MNKDLYVRNISLRATEEDVRKLFSVIGKVSYIHLINDAKTGQFKGCGYVKMASEAEARDALTSLDGARLIDRLISVTEARPQQPAAQRPPRPESRQETKGRGREKRSGRRR